MFLLFVEISEFGESIPREFKKRVAYCCRLILRFVFRQSTSLRLLSAGALFHTEPELPKVSQQ